MNLVQLKCPNCGINLQAPDNYESIRCAHCSANFSLSDGIRNHQMNSQMKNPNMQNMNSFQQNNSNPQAPYNYQESNNPNDQPVQQYHYQGEEQKEKNKLSWLWIIGWIFIFPAPLTILILSSRRLRIVQKLILIYIAWFFYYMLFRVLFALILN